MTAAYVNTLVSNTAADGVAYVMPGTGDTLFLARDGGAIMAFGTGFATGLFVSGTEAQAIIEGVVYGTYVGVRCNGADAVIQVNGSVSSAGTAVDMDSGKLVVGSDGNVSGGEGVNMGGVTVINHGVITGHQNDAIQVGGANNKLVNTGTISGGADAIFIDADNTFIINTGLITGGVSVHFANESADLSINNSGEWRGDLAFTIGSDTLVNTGAMGDVTLNAGVDSVVNKGELAAVSLGADGDTYDGRRGHADVILAGLGADFVLGGDNADTVYCDDGLAGADGNDVVRGGDGDDQAFGAVGSDNLRGDGGNDTLFGGEQFDVLTGSNGDDVLGGDRGADTLKGGGGDDLLTGGDQSDLFIFAAGFGHDVITDYFAATGGKHDVIQFSHALFADFAAIQAAMIQAGGDVVITVSGLDTLVLQGVSLAEVTADDFGFVP